ncbi:DUF3526 domain-containing protein [Chitinophaga agri]|uniref:DUF3526 domain-containing protein n=1 Tax=Chitinophaga agri TaxID=2703787 RepID=A0A6B9ZQ34_9BACT|nr:DUF3526 domain-containing protein [Chitinophaga agri]QHS63644.1 DUF3526 domain-containing protein [Chitinophaga agri]
MRALNNQIYTWLQIIAFELRMLLRTGTLPVLVLIIISAGMAALSFGHHRRTSQLNTLDSIRRDYTIAYEKLYSGLHADTASPEGKATYLAATHPAVIDYKLHRTAIHPPTAFSVLATGMSDIATYYIPVTIKQQYIPAEEKVNNPQHLLAGSFDVSFLIIYLLPLALICISYNLLAQEKEQGTLSLLVTQKGSITGILFFRLLLRYLLIMCCLVIILLISIIYTGSLPGRETIAWLAVSGAYLGVWTGIIWFILSWNAGAVLNMMTMLCTWLLLLMVLPSLLHLRLDHQDADNHTANYASRQREIEWETWDWPQQQLLDSFYTYYPVYRNANAYDTSTGSTRRMMAYYEVVSRRMQRELSSVRTIQAHDLQLLVASYRYDPPVYAQALLNSIARTDVSDYDHFNSQAALFRKRWQSFLYPFHFNNKPFTADDYRSMPVYDHSYSSDSSRQWFWGICYMLSLAIILLLAGTVVLEKKLLKHRI